MRFRAKLVDIACIQHFTRVVSTVSKLAKTCVLRISLDKLYFILSERIVNGGVSIWCELDQGHFFNEYNMDGLSEAANEIYLELTTDNLVRSLKTAQNAKSVKIKLTKKQIPCLTLEVELPSMTGNSRMVVHDIPVNVIPQRLWDEYEEPEMPDFTVSIIMPHLRIVRNFVDRMKSFSNHVSLSANQEGEMKLSVETDLFSVATHFKDLEHPRWNRELGPAVDQDRDTGEFAEARVDIKKFAQFLYSQQVNPTKVICNIVDNSVVHFLLLHEDVKLQIVMPVVTL